MALATKPKPTAQHRKRTAGHHRHSKPYLKTYWPYLPMLLIVAVGIAINSVWYTPQHVLGATSDFSEATLLTATNNARAADNETPLSINQALTNAAVAKAADMAAQNYWSHNAPDGKTPWTFIASAGYSYAVAGENLAYGFADGNAVVKGWMNSTEHRANILNKDYQNVGFGVASVANYLNKGPAVIVVAEYAEPTTAVSDISFTVAPNAVNGAQSRNTEPSTRQVSRVQMLSGQASWSLYLVAALAGAALTLFIVRHARKFHRWVTKSEKFIAHHPWLDIAMVLIMTVGFLLTRTSGFIR